MSYTLERGAFLTYNNAMKNLKLFIVLIFVFLLPFSFLACKTASESRSQTTADIITEAKSPTEKPSETSKTGEEENMKDYKLVITVGGEKLFAEFENNSSAEALFEKLLDSSITVTLEDYGDFEKVGPLPWSLVKNDSTITTSPGDVILYGGNQITLYYDQNTWSFTRLAHIEGASRESLLAVLGDGSVKAVFSVEKGE